MSNCLQIISDLVNATIEIVTMSQLCCVQLCTFTKYTTEVVHFVLNWQCAVISELQQ